MTEKIIVALDFKTHQEAEQMILSLGDSILYYKVGLELFLNTGGSILQILEKQNKKIFLDLKFHDIPNTTAAASRFAASLPAVNMFNIHASGGTKMIQDSVAAKRPNQSLIAVTALTSLNDKDIQETFQSSLNIEEFTLNLALQSKKAGADGVVCSALEAHTIKSHCGDNFITVCPGIRLNDSPGDDQKRVLTPSEAIKNGADYLVIGRPITGAKNPKETALRIISEIS